MAWRLQSKKAVSFCRCFINRCFDSLHARTMSSSFQRVMAGLWDTNAPASRKGFNLECKTTNNHKGIIESVLFPLICIFMLMLSLTSMLTNELACRT